MQMDHIHSAIRQAKTGRASKRDYQSPTAIDLLIDQMEKAAKLDEDASKYNGWTNRETWAVALHIDNNEWTHNHRNQMLDKIKSSKKKVESWTDEEHIRFTFSDKLKEWVEGMADSFFNGTRGSHARDIKLMVEDVGSLWRVNWQEIADNWIRDSE